MIYGVYFSPTSNTKKVVEAMCYHLDEYAKMLDITCQKNNMTFNESDFVVIGAPVYGGRIPGVSKERLMEFVGNNTPCVIVVTYGNRHYDDALVELSDLVKDCGFVVYGACAVIGRHTYGEIQVDRPNKKDISEIIGFIDEIYKRNKPIYCELPGNHHDDVKENKGRFHPFTNEHCVGCQICVKNCPVNAILDDCKSISDKCISCFRCIRNCPFEAKLMNDEEYHSFSVSFSEKLKGPKNNEFFK